MGRFAVVAAGFAASLVACVAAEANPRAVLEVFSSQACSSCRSAGDYTGELAARDDVVLLSFHVDYWDYLGWRDSFAQPEFAERQRHYAKVQGRRGVYTPQLVLNGTVELIPRGRPAVEAVIARASLPVPVSISRKNGTAVIEVGARPRPGGQPTTLRLVLFTSRAEVEVTSGENAGSKPVYHNVVRGIRPIGMWDGAAVKVTLPLAELMTGDVDGFAVLLQEDLPEGPGTILGAAQLRNLK